MSEAQRKRTENVGVRNSKKKGQNRNYKDGLEEEQKVQ